MKDKIDNEYIRDGVKLADGWQLRFQEWGDDVCGPHPFDAEALCDEIPQPVIEALVAQLKSQVDETDWKLHEYPDQTIICNKDDEHYCIHKGEGRAMNSLKAILDSRVLVMT